MSKLRVESFTISLDGFGAGPDIPRLTGGDAGRALAVRDAIVAGRPAAEAVGHGLPDQRPESHNG